MKIKELLDKIDLSKKYPGYFNKWIIRGGFLFIFLFNLFILDSNDWHNTTAWAYCPKSALTPCENPFFNNYSYHKDCINGLCNTQFIQPGEEVGKKPSLAFSNYNELSFLFGLLTFVINHFVYMIRRKKKNAIF